jgi:cyclophilin family peptidyl-prolyl cis-trans isomerase
MFKIFSFLLILFTVISCQKKTEIVTRENRVTLLTQYGKENTESIVVIETSFGIMRLRLYSETPLHRANFIKLIKEGHYDEASFYRIARGFIIQGGNLNKTLTHKIPAELNSKFFHKKGALSMARVDEDNPNKESSAAEFFIVQGEVYAEEDVRKEAAELNLTLSEEQVQTYISDGGYMALDSKYTVFGEMIEGFDVIDKIAAQNVFDIDKPLKKIPFVIKFE